ncbi:hypothetical protein [Paenibacillus tyrfis]|uniref:hypothetical protein n=1 Tax=Paenibacillus tyrfis TaxID=1501230 RepID=UPI000B58DF0E|nr:hypothetical protein [Paenibacillus tyrfis]
MWIVSTDEFDATTQEFEDERMARLVYQEYITERHFSGGSYRIYLAEVKEYDGCPADWKRGSSA